MVDLRKRPGLTLAGLATAKAQAHLDSPSPVVTPPAADLLDHLANLFITDLPEHTGGIDGAVDVLMAVAEQRGAERVIRHLVALKDSHGKVDA